MLEVNHLCLLQLQLDLPRLQIDLSLNCLKRSVTLAGLDTQLVAGLEV
jgi:hypothetical protein